MYIYARNSSQSLTKKFHFVCWLNKMYFSLRFHKENENNGKILTQSFNPQCLEHSVCTLRNLSYRLESEIDRDRYDDADVNVDPAAVKEQQKQGCFAGCGGRKKKKVPTDNRPMDRPKGPPQGVELIWQPQTVQQYFVLLRKAKNIETLEGSAGALHNLTACSWKVRSLMSLLLILHSGISELALHVA